MRRKWFRNVLGGLSFGAALFIFQACYGTPQDFDPGIQIQGQVLSAGSGEPIPGIRVSVPDGWAIEYTDPEGRFELRYEWLDRIDLRFEDVDSTENRIFATLDTTLIDPGQVVPLNITLEEIE